METITKDGILNSNELYLLQNFEANLVALNLKIAEQENKKNEVTCLFDTLSKTDSVSKINSKKDYAEKINKISKKTERNSLDFQTAISVDTRVDFLDSWHGKVRSKPTALGENLESSVG